MLLYSEVRLMENQAVFLLPNSVHELHAQISWCLSHFLPLSRFFWLPFWSILRLFFLFLLFLFIWRFFFFSVKSSTTTSALDRKYSIVIEWIPWIRKRGTFFLLTSNCMQIKQWSYGLCRFFCWCIWPEKVPNFFLLLNLLKI